jgi:hypothetical protein
VYSHIIQSVVEAIFGEFPMSKINSLPSHNHVTSDTKFGNISLLHPKSGLTMPLLLVNFFSQVGKLSRMTGSIGRGIRQFKGVVTCKYTSSYTYDPLWIVLYPYIPWGIWGNFLALLKRLTRIRGISRAISGWRQEMFARLLTRW